MANDAYQPKYEHLLMDPAQLDAAGNPSAKLAELKALIILAGDSATTHAYAPGTSLANAQTGNATSTIHTAYSGAKHYTNDVLLRIVTTVGATPTATFNIKASPDGVTYTNISYALMATPNTFVVTPIVITTATTNVYRIPGSALVQARAKNLQVVVSANTNVTWTIDAVDFGGVPL